MERQISDWVQNNSLTPEEIQDQCKNLLDNPSITLKDKEDTPYYSEQQMVAMFISGYEYKKKRNSKKVRTGPVAYTLIRSMEVGDTLTLPFDKWGAARAAASILKKDYGSKYTVTTTWEEKKRLVMVIRIA